MLRFHDSNKTNRFTFGGIENKNIALFYPTQVTHIDVISTVIFSRLVF